MICFIIHFLVVLLNKKANRVALTSMRSRISFPLSCSGRKSGGMERDILVMQCPVLSSDCWQRWHCLAEKIRRAGSAVCFFHPLLKER